jgi:hypothetical protein
MRKLLTGVIFLSIFGQLFAEGNIPYISPGLRIGWDFRNVLTIEPKVSFGVVGIIPGFINITIGMRNGIIRSKEIQYKDYCHIGIQMGKMTKTIGERKIQLLYGGGLGLSFDGKDFVPRVSIFSGMMLFATADFSYKHGKGFNTDIGIQGVMPIPLKKIDFGSPGG